MNSIEVIGKMVDDANVNASVLLAPLSNISAIDMEKSNGFVTFGVPVDVAKKLATEEGFYIGGLLLVEKEKFDKYREDNNER